MNTHTIEGLTTIYGIRKMMEHTHIEMPMISLIYDIINEKQEKEALLDFLITKE